MAGLLFHNARLREILGYSKDELDLCDTRMLWHDLDQRTRIIDQLRDQGGQILNEKVTWRTKKGTLVHLLLSYVQVAYQGGHVSFVGGKRVLWVYDITALTQHETQVRRAGAPASRNSRLLARLRCASSTKTAGSCSTIGACAN